MVAMRQRRNARRTRAKAAANYHKAYLYAVEEYQRYGVWDWAFWQDAAGQPPPPPPAPPQEPKMRVFYARYRRTSSYADYTDSHLMGI